MQEEQSIIIRQNLSRLVNMLVLNGTFTECTGLVHGKTGIAIFFFHYARYTENMLFADYASDLIDEMLNQIHVNSPADYEKGIAGIGVGLDYLIRNRFLTTEEDICEDLDQRIYRAVMCDPWQDFSLYNGLAGYGRYWITRLRYQAPLVQARECLLRIIAHIEEKIPDISIEEQTDVYCFLYDLQRISSFRSYIGMLEKCIKIWKLTSSDAIRSFPRLGDSAIGNIIRVYQRSRYFNEVLHHEIDLIFKQILDLDMEKVFPDTGLLNGYAGEGMLRLTAIDQTNAEWAFLL